MPKPLYVEPTQHNLARKKPKTNELIVLSEHFGKSGNIRKYIGRYQPQPDFHQPNTPVYEYLNGVLLGGTIYAFNPNSRTKKIQDGIGNDPYSIYRGRILYEILRPRSTSYAATKHTWNYLSEEDAIYQKEFEKEKKTEAKQIASIVVEHIKNGFGPDRIDPEVQLAINMMARCGKGTRRNKVTGNCDPVRKTPSPVPTKTRCGQGTRRNKVTGNCDPRTPSPVRHALSMMGRCGKGTRRNRVTGECDPVIPSQ
jgi:hypothetical protein